MVWDIHMRTFQPVHPAEAPPPRATCTPSAGGQLGRDEAWPPPCQGHRGLWPSPQGPRPLYWAPRMVLLALVPSPIYPTTFPECSCLAHSRSRPPDPRKACPQPGPQGEGSVLHQNQLASSRKEASSWAEGGARGWCGKPPVAKPVGPLSCFLYTAGLQAHVHSPLQLFLPSGPFTGLEEPVSSLPSTPLLVSYQVSWVASLALPAALPRTKEGHSHSHTCRVSDPGLA